MQACPSLRSSRKRWASAGSLACFGSREGEAWEAEVGRALQTGVNDFPLMGVGVGSLEE